VLLRFIIAYDVYIEYKLKAIDPYPKKIRTLDINGVRSVLTNTSEPGF